VGVGELQKQHFVRAHCVTCTFASACPVYGCAWHAWLWRLFCAARVSFGADDDRSPFVAAVWCCMLAGSCVGLSKKASANMHTWQARIWASANCWQVEWVFPMHHAPCTMYATCTMYIIPHAVGALCSSAFALKRVPCVARARAAGRACGGCKAASGGDVAPRMRVRGTAELAACVYSAGTPPACMGVSGSRISPIHHITKRIPPGLCT